MQKDNTRSTGRAWLLALGRIVAAATLISGAAVPVSAQSVDVTPNDPRPSPGWTLTPMFVFSQSSDSNVTLAGQGTPTIADSVAGLSPSVDLGFLGRQTTLNAGYTGSATRYFTVNQLDTFDSHLYANLKQQITRHVQVFAQDSAGWLPTTNTLLLAGVPFARVGSRIETLEAGVTLALTPLTQTSVGYRFEWVDFDRLNPLASQLLGGHSNGVFGSLLHQVTRHVFVGASYDIRRAIVAAGLQQFDLDNAEGNAEYHFSRDLIVSGGLGIARIAGSLPSQDSRVGPSWHAGMNYKFDRALAYLTYLRSFVPSYGIGGTLQNQEFTVGGGAPIALRDRLVAGGSYAWRRNDPLALTANRLTSQWLNVYGSFSLAPWLRLEGFYSRSTQDSHVGGVLQNRVGVQIVTLAPLRFR